MPVQYRSSKFMGQGCKCPHIAVYDDEDVREIAGKLINTDEIAASIGDFRYLPVFPSLKRLLVLCGEYYPEGEKNLYRHKQLEALCFEHDYISDKGDTEGVIDLNEFPSLRALWTWEYNVKNLPDAVSLQTLGICTENNDLTYLSELKNIDSLSVGGSRLRSLNGIENMKIRCADIGNSKKLTDISALEASEDTLTYLRLEYCPNIGDYSVLRKLKKLKSLGIYGSDKGMFENIDFIKELPELEFFVTNYKVLDGNIRPLQRLPYASIIKNRRHYNLKEDDLRREQNITSGD